MDKKNTKRKFNLLDAIIILVVLAIAAFAVYKILPSENNAELVDATISFRVDMATDYVIDQLRVGSPVIDADRNIYLGEVTDIIVDDYYIYGPNEKGEMVSTIHPEYKYVTIVSKLKVNPSAYGISLSGVIYSVGHTAAIRAGFAKMSVTVSDIDYADPQIPLALADSIVG